MFSTDKPIIKITEDTLDRCSFAKQLATAIINFQTKDSYAISLQGKWGSGKTSIINMVIEEIETLSIMQKNEDKIVVVRFSPWNITNTSQLINLISM